MSLSRNSSTPSPILQDPRGKRICVDPMQNDDRISHLPDELLLLVLEKISTDDAIKTSLLSRRWENIWKRLPFYVFKKKNIYNLDMGSLANRSQVIAENINKVINNLNGNLIGFETDYFSCQSKDSTWIRTLVHVKHTYCLTLENPQGRPHSEARNLRLLPSTFAHPTLKLLTLSHYNLETARAFNGCENLSILKLEDIHIDVGVLNKILASCPSLKALILKVSWHYHCDCLKIYNNNLRLLLLGCSYITHIEVSANVLDIFSMEYPFPTKDNVVFTAPRLAHFYKIFWVYHMIPHLSYNISCDAQDDIAHDFAVSRQSEFLKKYTSMEVSVDLMNPREVEKLKDLLLAWNARREELGVRFKRNSCTRKEGEISAGEAQNKMWEEVLDAGFRVNVMCMHNFCGSNEEEFAFASRFVTRGAVVNKLMIRTSRVCPCKEWEMEIAVARLKNLPKGDKNLIIECF